MARLVQVEVLEIRPNGVLVKILEDNRVGLIRRRELSWDRRVGAIPPMPDVGDQFEAKVIRDRRGARYVYLSLRQLTDPWQEAKEKYRLGQVVRGEVVNIRRFGVFVQIAPGVDAIVRPRDIPLLRDQRLEEVLSIGDQVQGVITNISRRKREIEISLTKRLQELSVVPAEERKSIQLDLFRDRLYPSETESVPHYALATSDDDKGLPRRYRPPIPRPERLLVIDDNETDLQEICQHLVEKGFGVEVDGVQTGKEALDKVRKGRLYGLAVIDLLLPDEHGAKVAEKLLHLKPDLAIVFTSANPLAEEEITGINGRRFPFTRKDPEAIAEWIDKLCSGYWEEIHKSDAVAYTGSGSFVHQLGMTAFARRSLPEVFQQMLARLRLEARVSQCMVLEVDSINKVVSILAADPPLEKNVWEKSLDGLYYSPVRTVVEDEEHFYAINIDQDRDRRFRYFFPLLAFKSCLGIPLKIPDLVTRHALFLLDEHRKRFEVEDLNRARLAARFMQVALERALLLDYMRRYEQRYSLGQLLGSLVHELSGKLDGLEGHIKSLPAILQKASTSIEGADRLKWLTEAMRAAEGIAQAKEELGELVNAYQRMVSGDLEAVDVNAVVRKVKRQLETKASEAGIKIDLEEQPGLPLARAVQSRLEQIMTNLVLNAIQQIDQQSRSMKQIADERGDKIALLQQGQIIIQPRFNGTEVPYPIQIIVIDTGPGIHYQQRQRIFLLDTSTRQRGHGLGLFISRNLAETMGGRIHLADSLMFIGSAFVVELPSFSADGG